jgi:plastocyanin
VTIDLREKEFAMRRLIVVPVVLFAAAGLAACGSSSSSSGSGSSGGGPYGGGSSKTSSTTGAATTSGPVTALGAKDFAFTPTALSLSTGGANVKVTNSGSVEHNFTVDGKSISKDIEAGSSTTVKVDLPAGSYKFHCKYHPTQMTGTITVG